MRFHTYFKVAGVTLGIASAMGCNDPNTSTLTRNSAGEPIPRVVPAGIHVNGVAFDLEYFQWSTGHCPPPPEDETPPSDACPEPFLVPMYSPHLDASPIPRARVSVVDPDYSKMVSSESVTDFTGAFNLRGVIPSREGYAHLRAEIDKTAPAPAGEPAVPHAWDPRVPPFPEVAYVPTITAFAIESGTASCINQRAVLLSDRGILDAVARHLSTPSKPVSVANLLDPARFGGVLVWWNREPSDMMYWKPAKGVTTEVSTGTTYSVSWDLPGAGPAGAQSPLGFFVSADPAANIGLTATVLPPSGESGTLVTATVTDPVTDETKGRPFAFHQLVPLSVRPGVATYVDNLAVTEPMTYAFAPLTPEFCVPTSAQQPPAGE